MIRLLLDHDITGFRALLSGSLENMGWAEYRLVEFTTLREAGLPHDTADRIIWRHCQQNSLILLTANRNRADIDSLEQTLMEENTPDSLPVVTVSDQQKLFDSIYRERCVERLLEIVFDLSSYLGTGRLYIP
ncbi:MAG: ACP S-malonyltransferase [Blastocatellia bacterium]|nr:ACP S-malonyltransferase [Blastocatellia bacterium]